MSEVSDPIVVSSSDEESPPEKKLKSILMGKMVGITITPILKEDENKAVCVISDEEAEYESESEVKEILDDYSTQDNLDGFNYNKEINNKNEDFENKDCEMVFVNNSTEQIIDLSESEVTEDQVDKNQDKSHISLNNEIDRKSNGGLENKKSVSDKISKQIIDITENNEDNDVTSCIIIDEPIENDNTNSINSETYLENCISSQDVNKTVEQRDDSLINQSKISPISTVKIANETSASSSSSLIDNFLEICKSMLENTEYNLSKQFEILKQYYKKCEPTLIECENFKRLIENSIKKVKLSPHQAVISFGEVFTHVKDLVEVNTVEVSKKKKIRLKKLEYTIKLLISKIKELENEEVDFDDEEDSSYLKLERYINRLNKLYFKYCEYLKSNPYSGRITFSKLNFVDSKYNEINRAISRKYNDNKKFPSYLEMENFIKNILEQNHLELTDTEIKIESQHCFKKLGELLQTRRKRELYDTHYSYIQDSGDDPANKDSQLRTVLDTNFTTAQRKIEILCQEYVIRQEDGEEQNISCKNSTDSSDSETEDE